MGRRYLITGGAGFIGTNFIRFVLENEQGALVTNVDALTYAGVKANVERLDSNPRYTFVHGDVRDGLLLDRLMGDHDAVIHFAAETHVDRSIDGPAAFLETNVIGTGVLLQSAMRNKVGRFIHVSTDEVYGSIETGSATSESPLLPSSPYAASKAASDLLVHSYLVTYGFGAIVTRCTNNYGPHQFPEKAIPLFITNLIDGKPVPLYGEGQHQRDWLYVEDHCAALHLLVEEGEAGEIYNIGADSHLTNLDVATRILEAFGFGEDMLNRVADRPGHDFRYAVDSSKIRSLGWAPAFGFDEWLERTIDWYRSNEDWWRPLKEFA